MLAHEELLVRANAQIAAWLRRTKQDKASLFVFGEVRIGAALVDGSGQQAARARKAAALMANGRQINAVVCGRIPEELIPMTGKASFAIGRFEHNQKRVAALHVAAWV